MIGITIGILCGVVLVQTVCQLLLVRSLRRLHRLNDKWAAVAANLGQTITQLREIIEMQSAVIERQDKAVEASRAVLADMRP